MENFQLKRKIGNAAKWSSITEVLVKIITPITNMLLARVLAPEAFGVVATATMILSFADLFTDAGFQKYLIQHEFTNEYEKKRSADVAFWTNFALSLFLWLLIFIFRDEIAYLVGNPGRGNVIAVACIQLPILSFSSIQTALYKRDFNFRTLFIVRVLTALIPVIITIPLAIFGLSYWALIIGTLCSSILNAVILTIKSKWKPTLFYSFTLLKKMFSFSFWTLLESLSIWLTLWIDAFIIGSFFNEYYLGLYRNSLNMVNSLMAVVSSAIIPVLFSSLSRLQNDEFAFQKVYFTIQKFVSYLLFPMGIGVFIFSDLATHIILGKKWNEAADIVGIWSLMSVISIIFSNFNGEVYRAKGRPKLSFLYQIIHLLFLIPSLLVSKEFGFWVLVYTRSLMRLQGVAAGFIFMKIFMGFSIKTMITNTLKPLFCATIMGIFVYYFRQFSYSIGWSIFSIFIGILIYIFLFILISKNDARKLNGFFRAQMKSRI